MQQSTDFSFHFVLPFLILALVLLHLYLLHSVGSSNPFPLEHRKIVVQKINFYPYFVVKDLLGLLIYLFFLLIFISYIPNYLGHSDNYIEANPLVTPEHIVPEFYFLPFYAILRSIPNKLGGIIAMFFAILLVLFIPIIGKYQKLLLGRHQGMIFLYLKSKNFYWLFISIFLLLGIIGGKPVEEPYASIGFYGTIVYFVLVLTFSLLPYLENRNVASRP